MEAYFPVVAKRKLSDKLSQPEPTKRGKREEPGRFNATEQMDSDNKEMVSSTDVTNRLLTTLSDPANPITHSNIGDRTQHYVAFATGHQVAEERVNRTSYMIHREDKLHVQHENTKSTCSGSSNTLKGVIIYINGYLENTTDIELKRLVIQQGGQILGVPSQQCTHIVTSRGLSGSKTQKMLNKKRSKVHIVKPEWVFDSIAIGKRRPEHVYTLLRPANTSTNKLAL